MRNTTLTRALLLALGVTTTLISCEKKAGEQKNTDSSIAMRAGSSLYQKKFTNNDYYKDGKFDAQLALQAYVDMFDHYGVPLTDYMKENMWVTDFGLNDFENVGMAGVFWFNDSIYRHFGHEFYLLPNQMMPEHRHENTKDYPAKYEAYLVRHGSVYNFGIGEPTPNPPAIPQSQLKEGVTVWHWNELKVGDRDALKEIGSPHFMLAGDHGAIVTEFGTYQDGNGMFITNPKAVFYDAIH